MMSNIYMKFEAPSIAGNSQTPGHKGEIEVLSWNHSFEQPTSPTRSQAGPGTIEPAKHANFIFTKYVDSSTNELLKYCWQGKQIGKATLTCCRGDGSPDKQVEYLTIVMEHVVIANYSVSTGPVGVLIENVALDYGIVQYNYKPLKEGKATNKVLSAKHNLQTGEIE